jgi:serine/threonine-protein kinase
MPRRLNCDFALLAAHITAAVIIAACGADAADPTPSGPYFPNGSRLYQDVSDAPVRSDSPITIMYLANRGGFGGALRIDFGMQVVEADAGTPARTFQPSDDWFAPDCDADPVPVPADGALEAEDGYACTSGGDCHLIVLDRAAMKLYEMWKANITADAFTGGCLAVWDLDRVYGVEGRGAGCSSADAAGLPIAPLLLDPDEVASGSIDHPLRVVLPNDRIRPAVYVAPATHPTLGTGDINAPSLGTRLRLAPDFPLDGLSPPAQVVARAMQRYGLILADGGTLALTARSDRYTEAKWDGLLGEDALASIPITAFQVVDAGAPTTYSGTCQRAE